jgi:hypothetical protein
MLFIVGAEDLVARPAGPADAAAAAAPLPAPIVPGNYERTGMSCVMGLPLEFAVEKHAGFEFIMENKNKWGWVGMEPGAELILKVDTRSQYSMRRDARLGKEAAAGDGPSTSPPRKQIELMVNFLYSYEHMGRFRVSCRSGCACDDIAVDGHSTKDHYSQSRPTNGLFVSDCPPTWPLRDGRTPPQKCPRPLPLELPRRRRAPPPS